jgi:hypothetical protein
MNEIINRINEQNIHFLFKMKILSLLSSLLSYEELKRDIRTDFIEGELRPFMMPKNPKQIFSLNYARTVEGQNESTKEVEYIKNILQLLAIMPTNYKELATPIDNLIAEYQGYLSKLESIEGCNRDLVNALFELEDSPVITEVSRNFLLASYKKTGELAIYHDPYPIVYTLFNNSEKSILACDSPIDMLVSALKYNNGRVTLGLKVISHIQAGTAKIFISSSL